MSRRPFVESGGSQAVMCHSLGRWQQQGGVVAQFHVSGVQQDMLE